MATQAPSASFNKFTRRKIIYSKIIYPRYPPSRFAIFRSSDSQISISEIRYPPQIPATVTPRPTKLHTQGQADIYIHLQDKCRYLQIVLLNRCEGADQSQSGLWRLFTP
jgi:hypothetical protein